MMSGAMSGPLSGSTASPTRSIPALSAAYATVVGNVGNPGAEEISGDSKIDRTLAFDRSLGCPEPSQSVHFWGLE